VARRPPGRCWRGWRCSCRDGRSRRRERCGRRCRRLRCRRGCRHRCGRCSRRGCRCCRRDRRGNRCTGSGRGTHRRPTGRGSSSPHDEEHHSGDACHQLPRWHHPELWPAVTTMLAPPLVVGVRAPCPAGRGCGVRNPRLTCETEPGVNPVIPPGGRRPGTRLATASRSDHKGVSGFGLPYLLSLAPANGLRRGGPEKCRQPWTGDCWCVGGRILAACSSPETTWTSDVRTLAQPSPDLDPLGSGRALRPWRHDRDQRR
jgi:hypothetical protein